MSEMQVAHDFVRESDALHALLRPLDDAAFAEAPTAETLSPAAHKSGISSCYVMLRLAEVHSCCSCRAFAARLWLARLCLF